MSSKLDDIILSAFFQRNIPINTFQLIEARKAAAILTEEEFQGFANLLIEQIQKHRINGQLPPNRQEKDFSYIFQMR